MRIIAGELRGRRLAAPEGNDTRPMLDRVREALFSTLGDLVPGARVLDLFAGSGSLGLEAASRGAERVRFVESAVRAWRSLEENVRALGLEERVEAVRGDALDPELWPFADGGAAADVVFLDPPYPLLRERRPRELLLATVERLSAGDGEQPAALVLHTHPRDLRAEDLRTSGSVEKRVYGNTALWYVWGVR